MLAKFLSLFSSSGAGGSGVSTVQDAVAVLLVEAGHMDGRLGDEEKDTILRLLGRHFSLSDEAALAVLTRAERRAAEGGDLFPHTKTVKDALSYEERLDIIEMVWEVVYADGVLHDFESNLMRRLARLLYVEDKDSGLARKRVLDRRRS